MGVNMNACSVSQLERFGRHYAGTGQRVGIRVNPGVGSGGFSTSTTSFSKTNVGGPSSSFGIWHELIEDGTVPGIVDKYGLKVERIHTHIGSGSDPVIWQQVATQSLSFCDTFPSVTALNLGGGYKVGNALGSKQRTYRDWQARGSLQEVCHRDGRGTVEIEAGNLLGSHGWCHGEYQIRTGLHRRIGSHLLGNSMRVCGCSAALSVQNHPPITVLPSSGKSADVGEEAEDAVVVGHCCESGDLMTPKPGEPEDLAERTMRKAAIGDFLIMDGCGAYCSGMSTKNYNSFPEAPEVLVDMAGKVHLIRGRQALEQIYENEITIAASVLENASHKAASTV
jgi:diaminopimelate decarboxylase